jgi:5-methylcytosine-specific restriction enzyme subunit McrC
LSEATKPAATVGRIPVRNLWLLMLYASRLYRALPTGRRFAAQDNPDEIPDLVAEILTRAVERRLRRNLSSEFDRREADLTRVRGRIDALRTERRHLLQRGRIACSFDELTTDTPKNRYIRAALDHLHRMVRENELKRRCRITASALDRAGVGTDGPRITMRGGSRSPVSVGRTNTEDRQMLAAAELAFSLRLPTEEAGQARFPAPDRDERWARLLFEAAVGGFYNTVLSPQGWSVRTGSKLNWQIESPTAGIELLLPGMTTDIILERQAGAGMPTRSRLVIDTKFTSMVGTGQYGNPTLRSGYIYQIYAYLRSQERKTDPLSLTASGMLLHPTVGGEVDEAATIQGHRIRFATVDLAAEGRDIRNRLMSLALDGWQLD